MVKRQMTRLIIPALVALLVSGPAWADDDDAVLLHCSGLQVLSEPTVNPRETTHKNFLIARDKSWIDWVGKKRERTEVFTPFGRNPLGTDKHFLWGYTFGDSGPQKRKIKILFDPLRMTLTRHIPGVVIKVLECFPIKSPFKFWA
jgi:hypothetical protein